MRVPAYPHPNHAYCFGVSDFSHSKNCVVVFQCCFNLQFLDEVGLVLIGLHPQTNPCSQRDWNITQAYVSGLSVKQQPQDKERSAVTTFAKEK